MRRTQLFGYGFVLTVLTVVAFTQDAHAQTLPFDQKVEVYRDDEKGVTAFSLRLEQPFLAEEFEKSNFIRLKPLDPHAWLVYPRETRFKQKHAEFYGRLRGKPTEKAKLKLSYEIISENLDGSRKVDERSTTIEITLPEKAGGAKRIYTEWARQQNVHFAGLLNYYPENSFFEYVLLQSRDRYGVRPPALPDPVPTREQNEFGLYHTFSGGLAVQQSLQRETLARGSRVGDLSLHVSTLKPPQLNSLNYGRLLEERIKDGTNPSGTNCPNSCPPTNTSCTSTRCGRRTS